MSLKLAIIGFGEAARAMAAGFRDEQPGVTLSAYARSFGDPGLRDLAARLGVVPGLSIAEAVQGTDIVLSLVVGSAAVAIAEAAAPHLREGQIYVDLNSASPDTKKRVADAIGTESAWFVEGAIMDAVKPRRHKVAILLAGPRAEETAQRLNAVGMRCEAVGDAIGQACAVKMIRSVMVKGLEALLIEGLGTAERVGVTERILDSVEETFRGYDWRRMASHLLRRTHEHGARRVAEMKEAVATLRSLGVEPVLSDAITATIAAGHERLRSAELPEGADYRTYLKALASGEEPRGEKP